ncbi:MAG TPA: hypothetical protein VHR72_02265 [Gemmataceae bacterium]|jgi:hypothetical protein|nr:hypothetical protein [Gemmataceae bacterium]
MKVSDLNLNQVNPNSFVNLNSSWNNVQIQAFQQSMQADPKAMSAASSLNSMLQQRGLLPQGQQVVGSFGGKFFTINTNGTNAFASQSTNSPTTANGTTTANGASNANGTANANTTTSTNASSSTSGSTPNADTMVQGLAAANITNITNIHAKNVIDINASMSPKQIRSLVKSLQGNSTAQKNADSLTRQLRQNGMLGQNQSVLGMANGNVFTGQTPSAANQGGASNGSLPGDDDDTSTTNDTNKRKREH